MKRSRLAVAALALSATVLAACGDDKKSTPATTPVKTTTVVTGDTDGDTVGAGTEVTNTATDPTSVTGTAAAGESSAAGARVSANTATNDELIAALTAAGVTNAAKWANEIQEYRPYDSSDTALTKLQDNLTKYNPDDATLRAILGVLKP